MVVIVIVGVLSAVALPNFIGTKHKADAQSTIGAMAAQAKLCGANMIIQDPTVLDDVAGVTVGNSKVCDGDGDVAITNTTPFADGTKIGGVRCAAAVHDGTAANKKCTLTVDDITGSVTGAWGA